jgi:hypothetical protein
LNADSGHQEAIRLIEMGKELNEIKDEALKLNSIIEDWKANYE